MAAGDYSLNVQPLSQPAPVTITPRNIVSGDIVLPGESDRFSFSLTSDQRIYFDSYTADINMHWDLWGPSGHVVNQRSFTASDSVDASQPVLDLAAGDYWLTVDARNDHTGSYSFQLKDLTVATTLTPGVPVTAALVPANETRLYQFTANVEQYYFDSLTTTVGRDVWWRLIDPYENIVFISQLQNDVDTLSLVPGRTYYTSRRRSLFRNRNDQLLIQYSADCIRITTNRIPRKHRQRRH